MYKYWKEAVMFYTGYCDYNRSNPDYDIINRPDGSGDYLLLYFLSPMKVQIDGGAHLAEEGAFILYTPGEPQIYQAVKRFKNSFVHFTCDDDGFIASYDLPVNRIVYPPYPDMMNALFKSVYVESVTKQDYYQEQIDKLMHQMFILLSRQLHTFPEGIGSRVDLFEQFRKARIEILTHIDRKWDAENMAALTNLGTSQFYSYYKLFFNRSPKSELLDARIERSKYLLRIEKLQVGQAAAQAGFDSLPHFTRYFKKACGMTPSEYSRL